jgi:putative endonuclease
MYTVYILWSETLQKYYIGYSSDPNERLKKHNRKSRGFTSAGRPWVLVYSELHGSKEAAMKREKELKQWKDSKRIQRLIAGSEHPG